MTSIIQTALPFPQRQKQQQQDPEMPPTPPPSRPLEGALIEHNYLFTSEPLYPRFGENSAATGPLPYQTCGQEGRRGSRGERGAGNFSPQISFVFMQALSGQM